MSLKIKSMPIIGLPSTNIPNCIATIISAVIRKNKMAGTRTKYHDRVKKPNTRSAKPAPKVIKVSKVLKIVADSTLARTR